MSDERERILQLVAEKKLSVDEAMALLSSLDASDVAEPGIALPAAPHKPKPPRPPRAPRMPRAQPRFLRIRVEVSGEDSEDISVNLALPIAMARAVGPMLGNMIPGEAQERMREQGVDFASFELNALLDRLDDLEGQDIIDIDFHDGEQHIKVNIYAE